MLRSTGLKCIYLLLEYCLSIHCADLLVICRVVQASSESQATFIPAIVLVTFPHKQSVLTYKKLLHVPA